MTGLFELAGGTVIGKDHRISGKANQDAFRRFSSDELTVAVVCDGCSEGKHSEVGSQIATRLIVETICRLYPRYLFRFSMPDAMGSYPFWRRVRQDVTAEIRSLANKMGPSLSQVINEYFLFTVVGVMVTPFETVVFSLGDGVFVLNGEVTRLGPFEGNRPPYLGYGITGSKLTDERPELLEFTLQRIIPTSEVGSVLIGSDGVEDLLRVASQAMPGKSELVGSIDQFWINDRYFTNPDNIRRRLALINREITKADWPERRLRKFKGLLPDDTALVTS